MKWLLDENFDNDIFRGVLRRASRFDAVRVQDIAELAGTGDDVVLTWATLNQRVLLTHDLSTMIPAMRFQLQRTSVCAPIVLVPDWLPLQQAIGDILLLDECGIQSDWASGVIYLPLE